MRDGGKHGYGGGRGEKGFVVSKDSIKDEVAFRIKARVDARLRRLVRDEVRRMDKEIRAEQEGKKCFTCGAFLGSGKFCSKCGARV